MGKDKWVTMRDVADLAKVGTITVSRVLRTPEKVSDEKRLRVQKAIEELGYVPDNTAGALSSSRSRVFGAIVSTISDSVFASTLDGLSGTLRAAGYELLLTSTGYDPHVEEDALRALLARRPDGIVLTSTSHSDGTSKLIRSLRIPVVEIWQLPSAPVDIAVGFSNFQAGHDMARHLIGSGRKNIAFLGGGGLLDERGRRRREGYLAALRAAGMTPVTWPGKDRNMPSDIEMGTAFFDACLKANPHTDAVMCVSDTVAVGVLCEARRRNLAVPGDLAVSGFGGFELAKASGFDLTTIEVPGNAIGVASAKALLDPEAARSAKVIDLGYKLAVRGTT
ncbi:MAG: LacI family DNA-binding transcriptional regulator [Roseibium sp.]|uniref:LacI family DNA-binding transcriptional regulator n=1 Tax=Roseibium sp. TaxID=1936156 RepID=UPI003D9C4F1A